MYSDFFLGGSIARIVAPHGGYRTTNDVLKIAMSRNNQLVFSHVNFDVTNADLSEKPTYTFTFYDLFHSLFS